MRKLLSCLVGTSLSHSRSAEIHKKVNTSSEYYFEYEYLEMPNLDEFQLKIRNYDCINITFPYKEDILKYLDEIDEKAITTKSVNTVVNKNNKLYGYNTDYNGFEEYFRYINFSSCQNILLIGAGGAARTIYQVFKDKNINITVTNRTESKSWFADQSISIKNAEKELNNFDVIINATSASIKQELPLKINNINSETIVIDILADEKPIYFIEQAKKYQVTNVYDGLIMLEKQAKEAQKIWRSHFNHRALAILGGAFNPIHNGHIHLANQTIEHLALDKIIFIPTYISPHKANDSKNNIHHRIKMIEMITSDNNKFELDLYESNQKDISYSYRTIEYIKNKYSNYDIYFIIGSDNASTVQEWKNSNEVMENVKFVCFSRDENENKDYHMKLINTKIIDQSSTKIREGNFSDLPTIIKEYIDKNGLYN